MKGKLNKGFPFLSVFDIHSNYASIGPFKDKKGITNSNASQKSLDESNCKPHKICSKRDQ